VRDVGAAYAEGRRRITEIVHDLDDHTARAPVPACPAWSVHDVVAHLSGICADIVEGRIDGVATDPWTAAQVTARTAVPLADLLDEWGELAPKVEAMAAGFGDAGDQWVADQATHEHDIRGALGAPGARDSETAAIAVDFMVGGFLLGVAARGLPTLEVRAGDRRWASGPDEPAVRLRTEPFEAMRSVAGRRSLDQLRALPWEGDPEPYLDAFTWGPFRPAAAPVVE
jgi:uncharacterized protein (TIGR03083 family)